MKSVFVVIVTYKGRKWYDSCFASLRDSTIPIHTIVIDNASNDGTVDYIKNEFPEITLIESKENLGFGKANNIGLRYALDHGCDYVFLLNQDAWIEPDTIERLIDIHSRHQEYGIVGPLQTNAEKNKVLDGVVKFLINPDNYNKELFSDLLMGMEKEIYPVAEINAAAWLLPRKTLEIIGGFDPLFLHYGEDWNYLSRVLFHKMEVGIVPKIRIVHDCVERVKSPSKYHMNYKKWLLQRSTDILYPDQIVSDMINQFRGKVYRKLITFKMKEVRENWMYYRFLTEYRTKIEISRKANKIAGQNWL